MARINRAIELIQQRQPVYYAGAGELTYENGKEQCGTWADILLVDFEHSFFDIAGLTQFMKGISDAGPTRSGHRTPAVITTLPSNCKSRVEVEANSWQIRHVLAAGVHGILHTHAREPDAVAAFVESCRYAFQTIGVGKGSRAGQRGAGGQGRAASVWGVDAGMYVRAADPWPLNPDGELILGLKFEDHRSLGKVEAMAATPGIAFAEWAPGDMGMSFGDPDAHDPPYSADMARSRDIVRSACEKAGIAFYPGSWNDPSLSDADRVAYLIREVGATIMRAPSREFAAAGRRLTGRTLPV